MAAPRFDHAFLSRQQWRVLPQQHARRALWWVVLLLLVLAILGVGAYVLAGGANLLHEASTRQETVLKLQGDTEDLRRQLDMERTARQTLESQLAEANARNAKLSEDLAFVRKVQGNK